LFGAAPPAAVQALQDRPADPAVIRSRPVTFDLTAVRDVRVAGATASARPAVLLNLFDDVSLTAALDRVDVRGDGFVWVGHIPGIEQSTVTLSMLDGAMAGSVVMPGSVYGIRLVQAGLHEVTQVDQARYPPELPALPVELQQAGAPPAALRPADRPEVAGDDGSRIDVMVLYTAAAASAAGGSSAMVSRLNLGVSETNTAYSNSGLAQRLRLVYSQQVTHTEHNDLAQDLYQVTNYNGTVLSTALGNTAASLRNTYGADLVMLVTSPPAATGCGIAWLLTSNSTGFAPYGFSVVDQVCISPNYTFAHELGHNMGARHDWYMDNSVTPYTYSHGHVNLGASAATRWRTIMSYNDVCQAALLASCTRLLQWSNPGVTNGGQPMGIAGGTSTACRVGNTGTGGTPSPNTCDADDHRALNNTANTIANFRTEIVAAAPPTVTQHPSSQTVAAGGTASFTSTATGSPTPTVLWQVSTDSGSTWTNVASATSTTYAFTAAVADTLKRYRAVFTNASGSTPSSAAALTVSQSFTDDPLQAGVTAAKAVHITELRTRINAVRAAHGLGAYSWSESTLTPGTTAVRAAHVTELRTALQAAYAAAGQTAPTYTDPTLTAGATGVKAIHIAELRAAVVALGG
jgi:hypothetical protein